MPKAAISHSAREAAKRRPAEAKEYDRRRGTSAYRGYDSRWRKLAKMILNRDPVCMVPSCWSASEEVDHIIPKREGGLDLMSNLQGLCKTCHSRKTRRENPKQ